MADIVQEYFDRALENRNRNNADITQTVPEAESMVTHSSSYVLACDDSHLSSEVDRWLRGSPDSSLNGVPHRRPLLTQRATVTSQEFRLSSPFWYVAALLLPVFRANRTNWRICSPSAILNSAELLFAQMGRACSRMRCHIQRLAQSHTSRDVLATIMDVILVVYAVGFLILSMYQASLIG